MIYYTIACITIQVEADLPIHPHTFAPKFKAFQVGTPGQDTVRIHHHFTLPDLPPQELGEEIYRRSPWAIYWDGDRWVYLGILPQQNDNQLWRLAIFNRDHTIGHIHHPDEDGFREGNLQALTTFPSDQILIARLLADRQGCYLHASGMIVNGAGLLFVGHSEAGKSTTVTMLQGEGEILCDDRVIVRRWPDGFRVHGTWSHGDIPIVSPASAPLRAIFLLEQAPFNRLEPIQEPGEIVRRLPFFVIKPLVTAEWWQITLDLIELMAQEIPVYQLKFDKTGAITKMIRELVG